MYDANSVVRAFIGEFRPTAEPADANADLFEHLGIDGDDASEFMESFASKFGVDMKEYLWYFHHGEEGLNFGGLFFKPPYRRVSPIPITVNILTEAVQTKTWPVRYPRHRLPDVRWDIRINRLQVLGVVVLIAFVAWSKFVS